MTDKEKLEKFIDDSSPEDIQKYLKNINDKMAYYNKFELDIDTDIFEYAKAQVTIDECIRIKKIIEDRIKVYE